jgi:hypothetical protein
MMSLPHLWEEIVHDVVNDITSGLLSEVNEASWWSAAPHHNVIVCISPIWGQHLMGIKHDVTHKYFRSILKKGDTFLFCCILTVSTLTVSSSGVRKSRNTHHKYTPRHTWDVLRRVDDVIRDDVTRTPHVWHHKSDTTAKMIARGVQSSRFSKQFKDSKNLKTVMLYLRYIFEIRVQHSTCILKLSIVFHYAYKWNNNYWYVIFYGIFIESKAIIM